MNKILKLVLILLTCAAFNAQAQVTLIAKTSTWKYLDNGSNQGTSWKDSTFNDGSWSSSSAIFGYGSIGATISTTVSNYATTYFRKTINLSNPAYTSLELNLLVDDGAVVYINGNQVLSDNMPGSWTYSTYASSAVGGADEGDYETFSVPATYLVDGPNYIAVEVHNASAGSSDLGFDLELVGKTLFVSSGDTWFYWDSGTTPTGSWTSDTNYNTASWSSGTSQLGYGDGDESTTVGYGGVSTDKYTTTYFYKAFTVDDTSAVKYLSIDYVRDDGIAVYINGTEEIRDGLPTGTLYNYTQANITVGGSDEDAWNNTIIQPTTLHQGSNVVAVRIHQVDSTSSDISFDLQIEGLADVEAAITRGPYLQNPTDTSMVIKWSTDVPCESTVKYGGTHGTYSSSSTETTLTTDHEVHIGGLSASSKYYYYISTDGSDTISGQDNGFYFKTNPTAGSDDKKYRFWVLGDQGQPGAAQDSVHSKFFQHSNWKDSMDLILMLGDNAYSSGYDSEFQAAVFDPLDTVLRNTPLYSTVGNHEVRYAAAHSINTPNTTPYYLIHTFPTAGEAGGVASGTESYFSWDYGNVHFISINAEEEDLDSSTSTMWSWLESDLQQITNDWIVVIVHQGPYTKGSHNSDTETEHIMVRTHFLPLLERYGVDVVMSGHSHSYERSKLVKGHFGLSGTYNSATHDLDGGYGRMPGFGALTNDCPYQKVTTGATAGDGAVYVTAGSSSKVGGGSINHPVMKVNYLTYGSVFVEVVENRLDFYYLESDGDIADYFSLFKDIEYDSTEVLAASTTTLTASWPEGPYYWSTGETTRSITVSVSNDSLITVANASSGACIVDSFTLDYPQVVRYPWSETDTSGLSYQDADGAHVLVGDAHTAADANGWYYYYNQNDPENLLFAVRNSTTSGNTLHIDTVIDYIELRYIPSVYARLVQGLDSFRMVFNYDWNVITNNQPNGGMDIKFYYEPNILADFTAVTDSLEGTNGDLVSALSWFKANQGANVSFLNSDISIDSINYSTDLTSLLVSAPNYTTGVGTADGTAFTDFGNAKNCIQFNGLTSFSGGTLTETLFDPTPVPLDWLSFKAEWMGLDAFLIWETATEINNDYFEIQRSLDGVHYEALGRVQGSGNSTSINSYSFTDRDAASTQAKTLYYRIKQVDYNGDFTYSTTERLQVDQSTGMRMYPVPARDELYLSLDDELLSSAQVTITIYNTIGAVVMQKRLQTNERLKINISDLRSGWYNLTLQSKGEVYTKRLFVE